MKLLAAAVRGHYVPGEFSTRSITRALDVATAGCGVGEAAEAGGCGVGDAAEAAGCGVGDVLTDSFGRHHNYLRISLTERCNLRCKF